MRLMLNAALAKMKSASAFGSLAAHLPRSSSVLSHPKGALNAGPRVLTHRIAVVPRRAGVDRAPAASTRQLATDRGHLKRRQGRVVPVKLVKCDGGVRTLLCR